MMPIYPGNDIQGWMRPDELQWLYTQARQMQTVVEIGSWKGRSTHALLSAGASVTAVDTWQTVIQRLDPQKAFREFLRLVQVFPGLTIMKMASVQAAAAFQPGSVDMVFIDGDHSYAAIAADLRAWRPVARQLICGHDYKQSWPGVMRAVQEAFGTDFGVHRGIWFHRMAAAQ